MKYGKIENGQLVYAPSPLIVDGVKTWTNIAAIFLSCGYKPIINTPEPTKEGYYHTALWTETDTEITQGWEEHEIPVDDSPTIEDYIAALAELGVTL